MMEILHKALILTCFILGFTNSYGQGDDCISADPFCADATASLTFPNSTGISSAGDIGCLSSTPNPAWYFLRVNQTGDLAFDIVQWVDANGNGMFDGGETGLDVDFIAWGPFATADSNCGILAEECLDAAGGVINCPNNTTNPTFYTNDNDNTNIVDCSYDGAFVETLTINNAVSGEYYLLLITNFNGSSGLIQLQQTNFGDTDAGDTDCSIVNPTLGGDIDACEGIVVTLDATDPTAANYMWTFDDGTGPVPIPSTDGMPMIDVTQTGTYEVTITAFDGEMGTDDIVVTFFEIPSPPVTIDTLELCDGPDGDGFAIFNLDALTPTILNGLDPANFTVTFHLTLAEAEDITNTGIVGANAFNSMDATIFARVENNGLSDCFDTVSFLLDVFDTPDAVTPDNIVICDNDLDGDPTNGFATFDLTTTIDTILNGQDPAQFTPTFHTSAAGANDGVTDLITNPNAYINGVVDQEEIFVRVENNSFTDCFSTTSFLIVVNPLPIINPITNLESCDDGANTGDGISVSFDTSGVQAALLGGQTDIAITYVNGNNVALPSPLPNPFSNSIAFTETITATLTNVNTGCQSVNTFDLIVNPNPVANSIPDLINIDGCDDDGLGLFDTTTVEADIIGAQTDVTVTYVDGNNSPLPTPLPNPLANTISVLETITATVTNDLTGCSATVTFNLVVNASPTTTPPTDLLVCDEDGTADEFTTMDLTAKNIEITNGMFDPTVTVSYHLTLTGANANDASIPDPTAFTNTINPQIVFARVTNNITGCFSTEALRVEVFLVPTPVTPADLEVCDTDNDGIFDFFILSETDAEIIDGATGLTVTYYLTEDDANNAPVGLEIDNMMYINVNDPFFQTIYARVFNASGCFAVVPLNLVILNTPMPNENPVPYEICDDNADGVAVFDLTSQEPQILDGLDPAIFDVTWFVDQASVDANVSIPDPTAHTSNTTTVIAVVTDIAQSTTTFCSAQVSLDLIVNSLPTPVQPALYELCDDLASGSDTDEFSVFDLRSRDDEIIAGNADWEVSYYLTQVDADAGMPTLPDMYQNEVPASQTVWVRVENVVTGCYDLITLTLVVNQLPSPTVIDPVEVCDDDFDGIAVFDLTIPEVSDAIENGETNFDVSFHESLAFAEAGTPAIADPANYTSASTTIFVRATDNDPATSTTCFRVIELELVVNPIPLINLPVPDITECTNGTNQLIFDLTQNDGVIYGGLDPMEYNLTYHESEANANDDELPIADPINYLVTDPGVVVWVRLENVLTGCATVTFFNATIAPLPVFTPPTAPLEACDTEGALVGTDIDGITTFDLTLLDAGIVAGDTTLTVTYYETQADLDAGNFIDPATAYVNTTPNNQTIFVQVSSTTAGMCMGQTTAELLVNPIPFIDPVPPAIACDDDNDGFGEFDLQAYANDLALGLPDVVFRFYETFDNAQIDDGTGQIDISVLYNNISGMTELFFVAENTVTGCFKLYSFELLVFPKPDLPLEIEDLRACDDDSDGLANFDLTLQEGAILVNIAPSEQGNFTVSYHESLAFAEAGTPAIADPTNYVSPNATIFVRVETNDGTPNNCPSFVEFAIEVVPPPVINPAGIDLNLMVCNDDDDPLGTVEFDLTVFEDAITGGDDLVNVTYYASLADLASDTPITTPEAYTNVTNPQTIHIVVAPFDLPECSSQGLFDIEVLPLPSPVTPAAVALCDDDADGIVEFDLTATVATIAGGENVVISIFDDLTLAEETPFDPVNIVTTTGGGGEILYENTIPGGQTLYARVDSTVSIVNGEACFVIVPFDVVVNPLPILAQDDPFDYTFCEEFDGDDTMGEVDLTTLADDAGFLVAPQNTADFTISYHNTETEAENNAFPIDQSVLLVVTDGDAIFFRIESASGCVSIGSVIFTVESRPLANPAEDMTQCADDPGVNGIPVQEVATFDLTQQNDVITGGDPTTSVVYYTSLADAQNMENPIENPTAFVNTSDPQTIYARAINTSSMCESTDVIEFMIFVEPLPYTDLSTEGGEICVDENTGEALDPFILDGTVEDALPGASYAYTWTRDGTLVSLDPTVTVDQQGEYELTITATYGNGMGLITSCDYFASASYVAVSAPVFEAVVLESSFNPGGVYTVVVENITGFNSNPEDFEFALDDGPFQTSTTFTGVTPGEHTLFGRRISGECSVSEVAFGIIDYPRFFTPNQDGFHDTWNIMGIGVEPNLNAQIYIFDRFGKLLKQLSPTSEGWDGTFNGQPMISDDYWFRINYTEPDGLGTQREFVGHFTLKR